MRSDRVLSRCHAQTARLALIGNDDRSADVHPFHAMRVRSRFKRKQRSHCPQKAPGTGFQSGDELVLQAPGSTFDEAFAAAGLAIAAPALRLPVRHVATITTPTATALMAIPMMTGPETLWFMVMKQQR
jgi:hypothetical protein